LQVSVIIPVYNAENFIRKAVESALALPETSEVLLVEDCSTDKSLFLCQTLEEECSRVTLLRHSLNRNFGAGASRNLGIKNARYGYIAFLDADDFFLPNRFFRARKIFEDNPDVEGVYEATGVHFWTEESKKNWLESGRKLLTTMSRAVSSEDLFAAQAPIGSEGHSHLDACVLKKTVFDKVGLFDEVLRLHQDTAMLVKLSAVCKMVPGNLITPVVIRGVHDHNRITAHRSEFEKYRLRESMWRVLWCWSKKKVTSEKRKILLTCYLEHASFPCRKFQSRVIARLAALAQLLYLITKDVDLLLERNYWGRLYNLIKLVPRQH